MKLLVVGAAGRTGRLVVADALKAGHKVTAFVHEPAPFEGDVKVVTGDASDAAAIETALEGQDAVIDTIGGTTPYKDSGLETSTAHTLVAAMRRKRVARLVVVSAMGVGDSAANAPFWYEYLLMPTMLRGVVKDKTGMEREVTNEDLDYTLVRPALLSDDEDAPPLRVITGDEKVRSTSRKDLARFLVEQVDDSRYSRAAVVVANV